MSTEELSGGGGGGWRGSKGRAFARKHLRRHVQRAHLTLHAWCRWQALSADVDALGKYLEEGRLLKIRLADDEQRQEWLRVLAAAIEEEQEGLLGAL
jgi:hypothetical protein